MTSDPSLRLRRGVFIVLLVCIALWRGWGLNQRGLLEHDEGHNLLAARTYRDVMEWVARGGPFRTDKADLAAIRDRLHRQGGTLYPAGKPGYVVLLALSSFVTGLGQDPALWLSWLGGMICVALVPLLLWEWRCRGALPMIVAMAGIGFSPLVGKLSREVGGVIWALAFGLIGMWLFLRAGSMRQGNAVRPGSRGRKGRATLAFGAGLFLGYGFTCHYNLLPLLLAAFAADFAREWARKREGAAGIDRLTEGEIDGGAEGREEDRANGSTGGPEEGGAAGSPAGGKAGSGVSQGSAGVHAASPWRAMSARWTWVVAGGLFVFLIFQIGSMAAEHRLRGIYPKYENYTSELIRIVRTFQVPALEGRAVGEGTRGWGAAAWGYAARVAWKEGVVALLVGILALGGAAYLLFRRRRWNLLSPAVFFAVLAVFWILHPWKVQRSWAMVVVALALLAGCVVEEFLEWLDEAALRRSDPHPVEGRIVPAVAGFLVAFHLVLMAAGPWSVLWTHHSPIPEAVRRTLAYVVREGGSIQANSAARSFAPLWKWAVIEEGRRPALAPALVHVDFSQFDHPDIVFLDPHTRLDPNFPATGKEIAAGHEIVTIHSANPDWKIAAVDLRPARSLRGTEGSHGR